MNTKPWTPVACLLGMAMLGGRSAEAQAPPSIDDLSFMAGCWEGEFRSRDGSMGVIEEHYTSPSANVMLGTTRYLLNGAAIQFELTVIRQGEEGVVMLPYPGGTASADGFLLTRTSDVSATFEAPEHDFPKRIIYRVVGEDRLGARIDDGSDEGQAKEWRLDRRPCPGS